ncbi:MAG: hypothetical protein B1H03_02370 [Planctomycetales bacterium 4484_113]|nr:MAG: hypothetical protein B1H03_02370 [Planctomycetales bacterium 4484_113]
MSQSPSELVVILKALADESRLRILRALTHRSLCVCELAAFLGLAMSTVSEHLSVLHDAGLVRSVRAGTWVNYFLAELEEGDPRKLLLRLVEQMTGEKEQWKQELARLHRIDRRKILGKPAEIGMRKG